MQSETRHPAERSLKGLLGARSLAIAAVVGTLVGVLSLLVTVFDIKIPLFAGGNRDTGTTAAPGQTTGGPGSTTTGAGPGPGTGTPSSPTASPHGALAGWSGEVWLARGGVDIDMRGGHKGDAGADFRKDDFTEIAPGRGASLIQWPGDDGPGLADCRGHVEASNDVSLFDVPEGGYFCVLTTEGQIAVVQYLGIGSGGQFGFHVTTSGIS